MARSTFQAQKSARSSTSNSLRRVALAALSAALLGGSATHALACACGCGVFDIGGLNYTPTNSDSGFSAWVRFDAMSQNTNFEGTKKAAASDNSDKKITTQFYTVGGQYMINHDWGVMAELPYYNRAFSTDVGAPGTPDVETFKLDAVGDLKLTGMYTGFSPDHSTGAIFGLKLPTGRTNSPTYGAYGQTYDPDTMSGTGSTDIIFGGFNQGGISQDGKLSYFVQGTIDVPVLIKNGYRPGSEYNAAAGVNYDFGGYGLVTKIAPVAQFIASYRTHDSYAGGSVDSNSTGHVGQNPDSGYQRLLIAPGLDVRFGRLKIFADFELPVYQKVNHSAFAVSGNAGQLVAPQLLKLQVGYDF